MHHMSDIPKIMIVSWGVFPGTGASSILTHNLGQYLGEKCVIVGEQSTKSDDWDTPKYQLIHLTTNLLRKSKGERIHKFLSFRRNLKIVCGLIEDHQPDYILCPFPDEYFLNLGRVSAKKYNVKFLPWFHNTYVENREGILKVLAKKLQKRVFEDAHVVLTISEGLTQYYRSAHPSLRFETMLHPFDVEQAIERSEPRGRSKKIMIAYTGGLNESCREAAVRCAMWITCNADMELHIFGEANAKLFGRYGVPVEKAVIHGFLSEKEFRSRLSSCDILLVPHGFSGERSDVEYNTIFPTRTIQLLTIGKPILVNSPPRAAYTRWMSDSRSAYVLQSDIEEDFLSAVQSLSIDKGLIQELVQNAYTLSRRYSTKSVVHSLVSLLGDIDGTSTTRRTLDKI